VRHKNSKLRTPRSLQLESFTLFAAIGMTYLQHNTLVKLTLLRPTVSTSKCNGEKLLPPGIPTQLWHNLLMKTLQRQPLMYLPNLATATAVERGGVATLTEANSRLTKQLDDSSQTLKGIRALLKKERNDRSSRKTFAPLNDNYCWTHGYNIARNHTSETCLFSKPDTNVMQTKTITLADPNPTKNDWQGRHLNIIEKISKFAVPHPFYNIMTLQWWTQVAEYFFLLVNVHCRNKTKCINPLRVGLPN
jgi:hypothetical protein